MGLKCFKTGISNVANSETLRLDTKFREFYDVHKNSLYNSVDTIFLNEVLSEIKVSKFKKGELSEVYHLLNISDQKPKCVTLTGVELVDEIGSDKNPLWDADIIISKLGLSRGYVFLNEKDKYPKLIGSTELIPYKVINKKFHPKFLKYFFFIKEVAKRLEGLGTGKTPSHKRVNPSDILNAKIPNLSRGVQIDIIKKIRGPCNFTGSSSSNNQEKKRPCKPKVKSLPVFF